MDELETLISHKTPADWDPSVPRIYIEEAAENTWPEGVPRDFTEFFRDHGKFIEKQILKHNKITRNFEDLYQDICMRLIASDLLNKFVHRAGRTLPETLEAKDCATYLGLDLHRFHTILRYLSQPRIQAKVGLSIKPLEGDLLDEKAVFFTSDIKDIDGFLPIARPFPKRCPWVSPLGFTAYLTRAIHNHFANWCRTRSRKYRDLCLPGTQMLTRTASGEYVQTGNGEGIVDWESRLVANALNDDDLFTVVESIEQECAKEDVELRDEKGAISSRGIEILDLMTDGRTVAEAIQIQRRSEHRTRGRARVRAQD